MSPICGILSRNDEDVSTQIRSMMTVLSQKKSGSTWLVSNGRSRRWQEGNEPLRLRGQVLGQVSFTTREQPVEQPFFGCSSNLAVLYEGNLYNEKELSSYLRPNHELTVECAAEIAAHLLEESYRGDLTAALKQVVQMLDGAYCLVASDGQQVMKALSN